MAIDWSVINESRISEKTQEIMQYCAYKRSDMTSRSFDLARNSFECLLDNIVDRNCQYSAIPESVRKSMHVQDECVALCSEKQALSLARTIVYKCNW